MPAASPSTESPRGRATSLGALTNFGHSQQSGDGWIGPTPALSSNKQGYLLSDSWNWNVHPMGPSAFTTLRPDMTSIVVSPWASKLHLPLSPSKSLVAAMAARIFSRSLTPALLMPAITTAAASQE